MRPIKIGKNFKIDEGRVVSRDPVESARDESSKIAARERKQTVAVSCGAAQS